MHFALECRLNLSLGSVLHWAFPCVRAQHNKPKFLTLKRVNSMPAPFFSRTELAALLGQYEADMQHKQPAFKLEPAITDHIFYMTGGA